MNKVFWKNNYKCNSIFLQFHRYIQRTTSLKTSSFIDNYNCLYTFGCYKPISSSFHNCQHTRLHFSFYPLVLRFPYLFIYFLIFLLTDLYNPLTSTYYYQHQKQLIINKTFFTWLFYDIMTMRYATDSFSGWKISKKKKKKVSCDTPSHAAGIHWNNFHFFK